MGTFIGPKTSHFLDNEFIIDFLSEGLTESEIKMGNTLKWVNSNKFNHLQHWTVDRQISKTIGVD